MTNPSYSELVTAVRREGEGIHSAAGMGLEATVPTCDGWDVGALVRHVGGVYVWATQLLTSRATEMPDSRNALPDGEPLEVFNDALDDVVAALQEAEAQTPVWNWSANEPHLGIFWARRMAHESSVHRYDAQAAHGVVQPIDAEIAGDGLDELIDVIAPRIYSRDSIDNGPTGTVALQSLDNGDWCLQLEPSGLQRLEVLSEPDVTVHGTTSTLMLALYSRVPWTALETAGDVDVLARWSATLKF
jgi:uncharacterized protein (TIGR03083 family)